MLWEVEISADATKPGYGVELARIEAEYAALGHSVPEGNLLLSTERGYLLEGDVSEEQVTQLANEQLVEGPLTLDHLVVGQPYVFRRVVVPLRDADDAALERISREGQLALNLAEMRAIQAHFQGQGRDPTDVELETLAQTWSEHCSHKTLKGRVECDDGTTYDNLLKETIFAATQEVRRRLGADDWCVSVFEDNAGVVKFDNRFYAC